MTLSLNGLPVVAVRLFHPWQGAWSAEVDFDLSDVPVMPSGSCTLAIGDSVLVGTIDPDASGKFGEKARARVIAGGGAWHRDVGPRQFHNDAGVLTTAVIMATAAEVGEKAVVVTPKRLGVDFMRTGPAPASRVLAGLDWYVTLAGVTTVGPRPPTPAVPDTIDVLSWDPQQQRADLATHAIVTPGTTLIDTRFGAITVRDVEQTFDAGGAHATAWCGAREQPKLAGLFSSMVRELGGTANLKTYRYRVVLQGVDGRLTLQAVSKASGAPDSIAIAPWYGIPGAKSTVLPGTEAAVVFLDGDPAQPVVIGFHGGDELASPVATQLSQAAFVAALEAFVASVVAAVGVANPLSTTLDPSKALTGAVTTAGAALIAIAASPSNYSLSTKVP